MTSHSYFEGEWKHRAVNQSRRNGFTSLVPNGRSLCLYDLGAAGGTPPPFLFLGDSLTVVNFEPDKRGSDTIDSGQVNIPIAIGPRDLTTIYLNRRPTTSSLLPANKKVTDRYDWSQIFRQPDDIFETIETATIETSPLDSVIAQHAVPQPDFIKIDVQGLSLEVLEGGIETINESVLGIEIEVEFLESYEGQRTFGAVHEHLYAQGFEVFRVKNLNAWYFKTSLPITKYSGQDTFCDLVYFRRIDSISDNPEFWTSDRAVCIVLLMLLYNLTDAAAAYFEAFGDIIEAPVADELRELITSWTDALDYFYDPLPEPAPDPPAPQESGLRDRLRRIMAVSPLDVYRSLKSVARRNQE